MGTRNPGSLSRRGQRSTCLVTRATGHLQERISWRFQFLRGGRLSGCGQRPRTTGEKTISQLLFPQARGRWLQVWWVQRWRNFFYSIRQVSLHIGRADRIGRLSLQLVHVINFVVVGKLKSSGERPHIHSLAFSSAASTKTGFAPAPCAHITFPSIPI